MNDHSTPSPSVKSNVSGGCQKDTIHTDTMFVESNSSGKRNHLWWKILEPRKEVSPGNCHHCALKM